jgi:hypothetical protein
VPVQGIRFVLKRLNKCKENFIQMLLIILKLLVLRYDSLVVICATRFQHKKRGPTRVTELVLV